MTVQDGEKILFAYPHTCAKIADLDLLLALLQGKYNMTVSDYGKAEKLLEELRQICSYHGDLIERLVTELVEIEHPEALLHHPVFNPFPTPTNHVQQA